MCEKKELTKEQRKKLLQKERFAKSESLAEAFHMVKRGIDAHGRFVHYTTLSCLIQIFMSRRWWLTRSVTDRLNDVQEAKKYGNPELLERMYQASFMYGSAESAAMWGLYCPGDQFGVMISLDGKAMREWFNEIRDKKSSVWLEHPATMRKPSRHVALKKGQIACADAQDVIYAATNFADTSVGGKNRSDRLYWFDSHTDKIDGLAQEINDDKFTGWIKDAEWRQENESRIAIRVKNVAEELTDHLSVNIPVSVLKSMRFTLSPWLKEEFYDGIAGVVRALVMNVHDVKPPRNVVSRSVLTGALEAWRDRSQVTIRESKTGRNQKR